MERLELSDEVVEAQRALMLSLYASSTDAYAPEDDPLREVLHPDSPLKLYDDVEVAGTRYRVIAAAPGADRVTVYGNGPFGPTTTNIAIRDIVDRAPLHVIETPMPIWIEAPPVEPPVELPGAGSAEVDLEALRLEVIKKVDIASTALIRSGFVFEGVTFSMSNEAQIRYLGMQADAADLPYPLPINSKDDSTFLILQNREHTLSFCRGAKLHVMGVVATGTVQKTLIRNMHTAAELLTYEDPRAAAISEGQLEQAESAMAQDKSAFAL